MSRQQQQQQDNICKKCFELRCIHLKRKKVLSLLNIVDDLNFMSFTFSSICFPIQFGQMHRKIPVSNNAMTINNFFYLKNALKSRMNFANPYNFTVDFFFCKETWFGIKLWTLGMFFK